MKKLLRPQSILLKLAGCDKIVEVHNLKQMVVFSRLESD